MKNKKMKSLSKADKVKFIFGAMDKETQEAVKSLINHLMVKKTKTEHGISD
jgi:hypothetical protein